MKSKARSVMEGKATKTMRLLMLAGGAKSIDLMNHRDYNE
jgi:hypothetical protein